MPPNSEDADQKEQSDFGSELFAQSYLAKNFGKIMVVRNPQVRLCHDIAQICSIFADLSLLSAWLVRKD